MTNLEQLIHQKHVSSIHEGKKSFKCELCENTQKVGQKLYRYLLTYLFTGAVKFTYLKV